MGLVRVGQMAIKRATNDFMYDNDVHFEKQNSFHGSRITHKFDYFGA